MIDAIDILFMVERLLLESLHVCVICENERVYVGNNSQYLRFFRSCNNAA